MDAEDWASDIRWLERVALRLLMTIPSKEKHCEKIAPTAKRQLLVGRPRVHARDLHHLIGHHARGDSP
eukprot:74018-Chlamydomonas_euryale.AAC.1